MQFDDATPGRLILRDGDTVLAEYVYEPDRAAARVAAALRSCCATRDGRDVTAYRPDDHVWHKGLSLALPNVGAHNFWGGPTYVHGEGYVQLANNGAQVHASFAASDTPVADAVGGLARVDERLDWVTQQGEHAARRGAHDHRAPDRTTRLGAHVAQRLRNARRDLSPSARRPRKGRENAGYAGIFWRGPAEFTGGAIVGPDRAGRRHGARRSRTVARLRRTRWRRGRARPRRRSAAAALVRAQRRLRGPHPRARSSSTRRPSQPARRSCSPRRSSSEERMSLASPRSIGREPRRRAARRRAGRTRQPRIAPERATARESA